MTSKSSDTYSCSNLYLVLTLNGRFRSCTHYTSTAKWKYLELYQMSLIIMSVDTVSIGYLAAINYMQGVCTSLVEITTRARFESIGGTLYYAAVWPSQLRQRKLPNMGQKSIETFTPRRHHMSTSVPRREELSTISQSARSPK